MSPSQNFHRFLSVIVLVSTTIAIKLPENPNPQPLEWWQEDIIYQIYPRSLKDSDGDGVGDLKGIESKLDYFVELGIGAIWISPIYASPMKDFGYDISNFTAIEPQFGTMDDFDSLSRAMKQRGIKLVMDFVPNHSSDMHVWFNASVHREGKYADYYVWRDAKGYDSEGKPIPPNNWLSSFGFSAWEWNDIRQQFYLHQFVPEQPDLNFENNDVLNDMLAAFKFWLDKGVDGFRMDTVPSMFEDQRFMDEPVNPNSPEGTIPTDYEYLSHIYTYDQPGTLVALAEFRRLLDVYGASDGHKRCMMIEAYLPTLDSLFKYYGTKRAPIADFPFNFEFIKKVTKNFNGTNIAAVVDDWLENMPKDNTANWLVGNHDQFRIATRFSNELVDAFNMLIMLLPGSQVTYYGEEIGMNNTYISWEDTVDPPGCNAGPERYHLFSRDPARTGMQWNTEKNAGFSTADKTWLPMNGNYPTVNVQVQNSTSGDSHLKVYKQLSALKKKDVWKWGSLDSHALENGAGYGFARIFQGHGFIYLANFDTTDITINARQEFDNIPERATVYTKSINYIPNVDVGSSIGTDSIVIGPSQSIVLEF